MTIRKLRTQPLRFSAYVLRSIDTTWFAVAERRKGMLHMILSQEVVGSPEIPVVEDLIEEPTDDFLVRFRQVQPPLECTTDGGTVPLD